MQEIMLDLGESIEEAPVKLHYDFDADSHLLAHKTVPYRNHHVGTEEGKVGFVARRGYEIEIEFSGTPVKKTPLFFLTFKPRFNSKLSHTETISKARFVSDTPFTSNGVAGILRKYAVTIPKDCPIGEWDLGMKFHFETSLEKYQRQFTVNKIMSMYVVFNPYLSSSPVYIHDEALRHEYVTNEVGRYFYGGVHSVYTDEKGDKRLGSYIGVDGISSARWAFHQHELLDLVLDLISTNFGKWHLTIAQLRDPVKISRALTHLIPYDNRNSKSDQKRYKLTPTNPFYTPENPHVMLLGNWNDPEPRNGVTLPHEWTNSRDIFKEWKSRNYGLVRYAQCFVFGTVLTTALRAIGIPSRPVTSFRSGHDKEPFEGILNLDMPGYNDRLWDFHVWTEAWINRADINKGHSWNVLDATPQERSGNHRFKQVGPAHVPSIKENHAASVQKGFTDKYDNSFVLSEVNGRICLLDDQPCTYNSPDHHFDDSDLGQMMSTKDPKCKYTWVHEEKYQDLKGMVCRLDVTSEYKKYAHAHVNMHRFREEIDWNKLKNNIKDGFNNVVDKTSDFFHSMFSSFSDFLKKGFSPSPPSFIVKMAPEAPFFGEDITLSFLNVARLSRNTKAKVEIEVFFSTYAGSAAVSSFKTTKEVELKAPKEKKLSCKCPDRGDFEGFLERKQSCDEAMSSLSEECKVECSTKFAFRFAKIKDETGVVHRCQTADARVAPPSVLVFQHRIEAMQYKEMLEKRLTSITVVAKVFGDGIVNDKLLLNKETKLAARVRKTFRLKAPSVSVVAAEHSSTNARAVDESAENPSTEDKKDAVETVEGGNTAGDDNTASKTADSGLDQIEADLKESDEAIKELMTKEEEVKGTQGEEKHEGEEKQQEGEKVEVEVKGQTTSESNNGGDVELARFKDLHTDEDVFSEFIELQSGFDIDFPIEYHVSALQARYPDVEFLETGVGVFQKESIFAVNIRVKNPVPWDLTNVILSLDLPMGPRSIEVGTVKKGEIYQTQVGDIDVGENAGSKAVLATLRSKELPALHGSLSFHVKAPAKQSREVNVKKQQIAFE